MIKQLFDKVTIKNLRSFTPGEHPVNLEPGQVGYNVSEEGTFLYIGNSSNERVDYDSGFNYNSELHGKILGKGWVRHRLDLGFTQEERVKLEGIEPGAEVNVDPEWDAILNKPNLGSAAYTESTDYATSEQGAKADTAVQPESIVNFEDTSQLDARDGANRDRENHTGTQSISTIEGLQLELDGKFENPVGTALQYLDGEGSPQDFTPTVVPFGGLIESPKEKIYPLFQPTEPYDIQSLRINTVSGTCTVDIQIGGVSVTGLSSVVVTSTPQLVTATALNSVGVGDRLTMVISSNSSAEDLEFTIMLEAA